MGLLSEGFYSLIFFGEEGWGGYILNFMLKSIANQERTTVVQFFYVSLQKYVSAGLKMKRYWIN